MFASNADLRPAATYRANLADGRLTYQKCGECSQSVFYPRLACPACGSTELAWHQSAGAGSIYSLSAIPGKDGDHVVCLVDLDEGFRMMSSVTAEANIPLEIGARVAVRFNADEPERVAFATEGTHV